jgi:hypothetical protein
MKIMVLKRNFNDPDLIHSTIYVRHMYSDKPCQLWQRGTSLPVGLFFDLDNVAFSHLSCNTGASRKPNQKYFTPEDRLEADRRLDRESYKRTYYPQKRREKYKKHGY